MSNKYYQALIAIQNSIINIETYIGAEKNFDIYESNIIIQHAVERNLEIIGEAVKRLLELDSNINISNSRAIINTRNKIAHGYDEIENVQIWNILINYLPTINSEINNLLKK